MQITSLSEQFGLLLRPGGAALQDVPGDWLRTALASRAGGVMLLRGFGADVDGFVAFTEKLGSALHGAALGVTGVTLNDRDELGFDYVSAPIYTAPLSGLQVFAGGLLDNPGGTLMGDGSPVERSICIDVTQASYQNAVWIAWQAGDIVVVDNTRVMHAREAFDDSARRVLIRYSRAAFAAAPVQR